MSKKQFIGHLGDVNPVVHDGAVVLVDPELPDQPEMEVIVNYSEDGAGTPVRVFRFEICRCTFTNGVLSDNKFHPDKPAWFAKHIESVEHCNSYEAGHLVEALCSEDLMVRAQAYYDLLYFFGEDEFDSDPLILSEREAEHRYSHEKFGFGYEPLSSSSLIANSKLKVAKVLQTILDSVVAPPDELPPNYDAGWYAGQRAMYSRFHGAIQQHMPHAIDLV